MEATPSLRVLCLIAGTLLIAPASAGLATAGEDPDGDARTLAPHGPVGAVTIVGHEEDADRYPSTQPGSEIIAEAFEETHPEDPRAQRQATLELLAQELRDEPRSLAAVQTADQMDTGGQPTGVSRMPIDVGDVDGDGLADVVIFEHDVAADTFTLRATSGQDGETLWEQTYEQGYPIPLPYGDLTGDGADDVLVLSQTVSLGAAPAHCERGPLTVCAGPAGSVADWSLTLRDGPTGDLVWTQAYPRTYADSYLTAQGGHEDVSFRGYDGDEVGPNAIVLPLVSDDHDGDGNDDVIVNAVDVATVSGFHTAGDGTGNVAETHSTMAVATQATVVSGALGAPIITQASPPVQGFAPYPEELAYLRPAGDAVGDGTGDLVWTERANPSTPTVCSYGTPAEDGCQSEQDRFSRIEMIDGATGATAWTDVHASEDGGTVTVDALGADLTGDGSADLFYREHGGGPASLVHGVLDGTDGTQVWQGQGGMYPTVLGEVGGTPGADLLSVEFHYDLSGEHSLTFERVDGGTGDTILETERYSPQPDAFGWFPVNHVQVMDDVDQDGVRDIAATMTAFGCPPCETLASALTVESGRSGDALLSEEHDGHVILHPAGDIDADGGADAFVSQAGTDGETTTVTLTVRQLPSEQVLWERTDTFQGQFGQTAGYGLLPTADQTGDGAADAAYTRTQVIDHDISSRVDGLDGATGDLTWGHGDPLS